jgi:hypothetical protein
MAIWRGEERVHPALIAGPGFVGLVAVVATFVLFYLLGPEIVEMITDR